MNILIEKGTKYDIDQLEQLYDDLMIILRITLTIPVGEKASILPVKTQLTVL